MQGQRAELCFAVSEQFCNYCLGNTKIKDELTNTSSQGESWPVAERVKK